MLCQTLPYIKLMMNWCLQVKRYEEKVHEDFLRDMEVTHASEVKVSCVMLAFCYPVYLC